MKTKKLIEANLPIVLANTTRVIGTFSKRFETREQLDMEIMNLEEQGTHFLNPHSNDHLTVVEVADESNLQ